GKRLAARVEPPGGLHARASVREGEARAQGGLGIDPIAVHAHRSGVEEDAEMLPVALQRGEEGSVSAELLEVVSPQRRPAAQALLLLQREPASEGASHAKREGVRRARLDDD